MSGKGLLGLLILLTGYGFSLHGRAAPLPNDLPPPGYHWFPCRTLGCFLLEPEGWSFQEVKTDRGILHYRLTRRGGRTAVPSLLEVRMLPGAVPRTGISLEQHQKFFVSDLRRKAKVLDLWSRKSGVLSSVSAISLHTQRVAEPVKRFSLLVANDKTGTLYTFTFTSPPQTWEQDWPVMQEVLSRLRLDEGV